MQVPKSLWWCAPLIKPLLFHVISGFGKKYAKAGGDGGPSETKARQALQVGRAALDLQSRMQSGWFGCDGSFTVAS